MKENEGRRLVEVCCGSARSVTAAVDAGAHRIELCAALPLGGLTPSEGLLALMRDIMAQYPVAVNVLIRPREGDYVYNDVEWQAMEADIRRVAAYGASGVVLGGLMPKGDIDVAHCAPLVALAHGLGMTVTFHRAFDVCRDPFRALDDIIALGCDRLLTSGQAPAALAGASLIRRLNDHAQGRIIIMPGAGVTADNAAQILDITGCREIHASCKKAYQSGPVTPGEPYENIYTTDAREVRRLISAIS